MKLLHFPYLILLLLLNSPVLFSQKQANNWYFGNQAAITFSQNAPQPIYTSRANSIGATASVSDSNGNLLFYSNGESLWNANHEIMLNGDSLTGSKDATNAAYSVPNPQNAQEYYLFTIQTDPYVNVQDFRKAAVYYSVINMNMDHGRGGIDKNRKNILLRDSVTEKIAAVPHNNGRDFWLLMHEIGNNNFPVYKITSTGISFSHSTPIGSPHIYNLTELQGHMKASPDNSKLAVTLRAYNPKTQSPASAPFEIFDFDNASGTLSNVQNLGYYSLQYGVSFSPNSELVYLHGFTETGVNAGDLLYQFNLNASDPQSTRKGLLRTNSQAQDYFGLANFSLQLGPDGRLYGAGNLKQTSEQARNILLVINQPNETGQASNVEIVSFDWEEQRIGIDLPNFIQSIFEDLKPTDNPNAPCLEESSLFLKPNPAKGSLQVELTSRCFKPYYLTIYNVSGQTLGKYFINTRESPKIDLNHLAPGLYMLIIELPEQRMVKKLLKIDPETEN
ncbi:T9SS type A sorting domain-containing protein [Fulvivirga kasyanovii]|uniref:T9SS type A sorting domain-containing protein n=1 Tax=Fulvivirga kasyanovii TaxID=396812 RepID=A0ABW9RVJ4_9BACT|nr:T9SS type A sorting domain-containing protein [Fulvivirga kasyanovii]